MPRDNAVWRKASRSQRQGECVEIADLGIGTGVRDSKHPAGPALRFSREEWQAFATQVRIGAYDL